MKKHGRYELPSPEELLLDCGVDGCPKDYIYKQLKQHKQKYSNDKRHQEKVSNYKKRKRYGSRR